MSESLAPEQLPAELRHAAEGSQHRVIESSALDHGKTLLAIDTALGSSVALGHSGRIHEAASDHPLHHAERIGELIEQVLASAGISTSSITGVVAGVGPGPFTGLRVGLAAAHAFAFGSGQPLLPLQSHEAVALSVLEADENAAAVRVIQDARRRELFVSEYRGLNAQGIPQRTSEPHLVARSAYRAEPHDVWPERIPAARLVQLAALRHTVSGNDASTRFEDDRALYLRAPDVKAPSAPKRVST